VTLLQVNLKYFHKPLKIGTRYGKIRHNLFQEVRFLNNEEIVQEVLRELHICYVSEREELWDDSTNNLDKRYKRKRIRIEKSCVPNPNKRKQEVIKEGSMVRIIKVSPAKDVRTSLKKFDYNKGEFGADKHIVHRIEIRGQNEIYFLMTMDGVDLPFEYSIEELQLIRLNVDPTLLESIRGCKLALSNQDSRAEAFLKAHSGHASLLGFHHDFPEQYKKWKSMPVYYTR